MNTQMRFTNKSPSALRLALVAVIAIGAIGIGQTVSAATATGNLTISATVTSSCVVGASTLTFASATSAAIAAGPVASTGAVSVNCTMGSPYTVALDKGNGTGATLATRVMASGSNKLNYSIYTSAALTNVWGDGTSGSQTMAGTGNGAAQLINAYGSVFGTQVATAGSYADTVSITVSY
jgi:spore coat protein U-like protein